MKYGMIAILIAAALVLLLSFTKKKRSKNKEWAVIDYIKENPDKSSIKLVRNGDVIVAHNTEQMMPLASTVKIILAIEYAEQAALGTIDPEELISFDKLDQFYIPGTDGGAHMAWFKSVRPSIEDGAISLRQVARGMMVYSSNANTEFLIAKLGLDNINERVEKLGMTKHSRIYPFVSALFVGYELFPNLKGQELVDALEEVSMDQYLEVTGKVHEKLKNDLDYKSNVPELNLGVQKIWSDRLPASTTAEYVELLKKINHRAYFTSKAHEYLSEVMETVMESPANKEWLLHSGSKAGSTAFVLTAAMYALDKENNSTELAYFFNDIGFLENSKLQRSMKHFELKILTEPDFLDTLRNEIQ